MNFSDIDLLKEKQDFINFSLSEANKFARICKQKGLSIDKYLPVQFIGNWENIHELNSYKKEVHEKAQILHEMSKKRKFKSKEIKKHIFSDLDVGDDDVDSEVEDIFKPPKFKIPTKPNRLISIKNPKDLSEIQRAIAQIKIMYTDLQDYHLMKGENGENIKIKAMCLRIQYLQKLKTEREWLEEKLNTVTKLKRDKIARLENNIEMLADAWQPEAALDLCKERTMLLIELGEQEEQEDTIDVSGELSETIKSPSQERASLTPVMDECESELG